MPNSERRGQVKLTELSQEKSLHDAVLPEPRNAWGGVLLVTAGGEWGTLRWSGCSVRCSEASQQHEGAHSGSAEGRVSTAFSEDSPE